MERILEGIISYTSDPQNVISFFIIYPPGESSTTQKFPKEDLEAKIKELQALLAEKDSQLSTQSTEIIDLTSKNSSLSFELEEKSIEIEDLKTSVESYQSEITSLQQEILSLTQSKDQKTSLCTKLQKTLNDLKNNRKTSEVLLEKQETMNKELIEKNVKLEKLVQDKEKKNSENAKIIQKLKEEITNSSENSKQRDEQVKTIIKKIKILEGEKVKFIEEVRRKDEMIKRFQSNTGEPIEVVEKPANPPKELKKAMEIINAKENEIKMMKDMIKSFQAKQQKAQSNPPATKSLKLPSINGDKSVKNNERSIRFREPSQITANSINKVDSFVSSKGRKLTPIVTKQQSKVHFADEEENQTENSPFEFSSVNKSPVFAEKPEIQVEESKNPQFRNRSDKKIKPKVSKKLENFTEGKEIEKKKLDFDDLNEKYDEDFVDDNEIRTPVEKDDFAVETEKSEEFYAVNKESEENKSEMRISVGKDGFGVESGKSEVFSVNKGAVDGEREIDRQDENVRIETEVSDEVHLGVGEKEVPEVVKADSRKKDKFEDELAGEELDQANVVEKNKENVAAEENAPVEEDIEYL